LPIRTLGEHQIELRLHPDVTSTLKVRVDSTNPVAAPVGAPGPEARREEPRTEKRGRRPEAAAPEKPVKAEAGDRKARPARVEKSPKAERPAKGEKPGK
jgi:hypothetical protein